MLAYLKSTSVLPEYLEELLEQHKKTNLFYAKAIKETDARTVAFGDDAKRPDSPFTLFHEAALWKAYLEREFAYEQGYRDCITLLKYLNLL